MAIAALVLGAFRETSGQLDAWRRRAVRGCPELRDQVTRIRTVLQTGVANPANLNGLWSTRVTAALDELDDTLDSLADRRLRDAVRLLLDKTREARGDTAPLRLDAKDQKPARHVDPEAALEALDAADEVIDRINALLRRTG